MPAGGCLDWHARHKFCPELYDLSLMRVCPATAVEPRGAPGGHRGAEEEDLRRRRGVVSTRLLRGSPCEGRKLFGMRMRSSAV